MAERKIDSKFNIYKEYKRMHIMNPYRDSGSIVFNGFIFTIDTNFGTGNSFTIPTLGTGYNYNVTTSDNQSFVGVSGDLTITFPIAGIYDIYISGDFPSIFFNNSGDKDLITDIKQWGNIEWANMSFAFRGCQNLQISAIDAPDLSRVNALNQMFRQTNMNSEIGHWDVSNVVNISNIFQDNPFFNQDLSNWDVSNVVQTRFSFLGCTSFNQSLEDWDVSNVVNMDRMMLGCTLSTENYSNTLIGWAALPSLQNNVNFDGGNSKYNAAGEVARNYLISTYNWSITDGGLES